MDPGDRAAPRAGATQAADRTGDIAPNRRVGRWARSRGLHSRTQGRIALRTQGRTARHGRAAPRSRGRVALRSRGRVAADPDRGKHGGIGLLLDLMESAPPRAGMHLGRVKVDRRKEREVAPAVASEALAAPVLVTGDPGRGHGAAQTAARIESVRMPDRALDRGPSGPARIVRTASVPAPVGPAPVGPARASTTGHVPQGVHVPTSVRASTTGRVPRSGRGHAPRSARGLGQTHVPSGPASDLAPETKRDGGNCLATTSPFSRIPPGPRWTMPPLPSARRSCLFRLRPSLRNRFHLPRLRARQPTVREGSTARSNLGDPTDLVHMTVVHSGPGRLRPGGVGRVAPVPSPTLIGLARRAVRLRPILSARKKS